MSDLLFQTNYNPDPERHSLTDLAKPLKIYKAKNPSVSFFTTRSVPFSNHKRAFDNGEYDLYETGRIIDTESLVMRAFNKKNTLMFRDGYEIRSKNEENLKYVKKRLAEIEFVSEKSFDDILREYAYNLVAFHNPYIVKVRKEEASTGEIRKHKNKKKLKPVAAYFCLAPETMEKRLNDAGEATRYRQYIGINGRYREFAEHNIIYTPFNKRSGFTMGTPPLESTKEDILALRRIEESVETLIYKSLFPIIHLKVGTDKAPAKTLPNGQSEVDVATQLLENIDDNGGIATSERIDITAIGAESLALRVESYLDYFKKRVFAGLGMSAIDFGDGDCYDELTETLTEDGWKFYNEIPDDSKIGTFNPDTGLIEFHHMNSKYEDLYIGKMICINNGNVDIKVSPEHTMYIKPRVKQGKESDWIKIKAKDLIGKKYSSFYILENAEFKQDECNEVFHLEAAERTRGREVKAIDCKKEDFARLLGWFISEGCIDTYNSNNGNYRLSIPQKEGPKLDDIISTIENVGLSFSVSNSSRDNIKTVKIYGKTIYEYVRKNIGHLAANKNIPREIFSWSRLARENLLDSLILGDGHYPISRPNCANYYTTSKQLSDDVQELAMSLGYFCKTKYTKQSNNAHGEYIYRLNILKGKEENTRLVESSMISEVDYTGIIYCYNVPNHLFVTRRNGKTTIQGNTTGRATGEVLSASLKDSVVTYQVILKNMVTHDIFTELLLESGRYKFPFQIKEEDRVYLEFNTVDTDEKIKVESHALNKATQGVITSDELREEIGMPPAPDLSEMHSVKLAEESNRQSMELASHAAKIAPKPVAGAASKPTAKKTGGATTTKKTKGGNTKTKNTKSGGGSNSAKAKTAPKNQYSSSQQLARSLTLYATSIEDINLVLTKINRELSDYVMLKASCGLIDGRDFIPDSVSSEINTHLSYLFDYLSKNNKSFSEIEFKIKKTIDKLSIYVNNIDLG